MTILREQYEDTLKDNYRLQSENASLRELETIAQEMADALEHMKYCHLPAEHCWIKHKIKSEQALTKFKQWKERNK